MTSSSSTLPQIQNDPIYPYPFLYISGMNLSAAGLAGIPAQTVVIAPGQCRDSNDIIDIMVGNPTIHTNPQPLYLNATVNGLNGLDQGVIQASTSYAMYVLADSRGYNSTGGLISLISTIPLIPHGYDSIRLLGFCTTTAGSLFVNANFRNMAYAKQYFLQPAVSVLASGSATTFTNINLSSVVPANPFSIVTLNVIFTPALAGDTVMFRPAASIQTTDLVTVTGLQAGIPQVSVVNVVVDIVGGFSQIQYAVSNAADVVSVSVFGNTFTLS